MRGADWVVSGLKSIFGVVRDGGFWRGRLRFSHPAAHADRSGRPLRARPEQRGGLRPSVRPGSLRSRRPNLRMQLTLRLVHCVPRLAQLTRRATC